LVGFDPDHFRKEQIRGRALEPLRTFQEAFRTNLWGGASRSGPGASRDQTAGIRAALPTLCERLGVRRLLDIPCGDFNWMKEIDLPVEKYLGADIVKPLIAENQRRFGADGREFFCLDLIRDPLPRVDAIFCRECLVHLSFEDIFSAIENIRNSGATYLLTTHFPSIRNNKDIVTGKHRSLNFTRPPFSWPAPLHGLIEYNAGKRRGEKCLSVWRIGDLPRRQ
jgi:SAM-dependent methyltransferase